VYWIFQVAFTYYYHTILEVIAQVIKFSIQSIERSKSPTMKQFSFWLAATALVLLQLMCDGKRVYCVRIMSGI
jgi:hypothetical protein